MKNSLLQNHPGCEKFSFNGWAIFNANLELAMQKNKAVVLGKWCFYSFLIIAVAFLFSAATANNLNEKGLTTATCAFVYLLLMVWLIIRTGHLAKKEQLHYYQTMGIVPLCEDKLQALQLIAPLRFKKNQWSETLEFWPRKPDPLKDNYRYRALRFDSVDAIIERREILVQDWGIEDRETYIEQMEYLISGEHGSAIFAKQMKEHPEEIIALVNKFDVFAADYIYDCTVNHSGKPFARRIWALETVRVIGLTSSAYQNGLIEESLAWSYILKASKIAHDLFDSEEEFHKNYYMGTIYWQAYCYSTKVMDVEIEANYQYQKQVWENYVKNCHWPIRNIPWQAAKH